MECQSVQLDLLAYLNGELGPAEDAAVESHLSSCPTCAEEATLMGELGQKLHGGLADWVNEGICPPAVLNRIEASIRPPRRKAWYQTWPATAGMVAAAAALIVLLGQHADLPQQMAALPLMGGISAHLFPATSSTGGSYRLVEMKATETVAGITLTVVQVENSTEQMRVRYTLQGGDLDAGANFLNFAPELRTEAGPVNRRSAKSTAQASKVTVDATFDPVPAGTALTFKLERLPARSGDQVTGPWTVTFRN
ncbi:MAG: anti-sigma factor family protein [Mycobacterium leprae]